MISWILVTLAIQAIFVFNDAESIAINICLMKPDQGVCMAYFPRYYYNSVEGKCKIFIYGGCRGNKNNFKTLKECENNCISRAPNPCDDIMCEFGGKCKVENGVAKCQCPKVCPMLHDPVCGHDGTEYSNLCTLNIAECEGQKEIKYDKGACRFY